MTDFALVTWLDSIHTSGWKHWEDYNTASTDLEHETIGFLMKETDYSYVLIQSRSADHSNVDAIMEIPKSSVIRFQKLKYAKKNS